MGRLAGFSYREITKRLKRKGFVFDRHARGSHEIWWKPESERSYRIILAIFPKVP